MIFFFLFSIIYCQNIIKNPSFEEFENNQIKNWRLSKESQIISSDIHSGKYSLYWKQPNHPISNIQIIQLEKGFQYEMCIHYKIKNIQRTSGAGFIFTIQSVNKTSGFHEYFNSRAYYRNMNWRKTCHLTGIIKNLYNGNYYLDLYSVEKNNSIGEIFVDDVSVRRINFRIAINNDRDEVYDDINVVYQINGLKENYNLSDFELITRIKDNNIIYYDKITEITSFFFTKKISIKNLKLKDNNFYQVESILKNKKDNITDISFYSFKKIPKKNRNVTIDEYGRMLVNGELFFPFGVYLINLKESDLMLINKTHLNSILSYRLIDKKTMDMIYKTQQGRLKVYLIR